MSWIEVSVGEACELRSAAGHDPKEPTSQGNIRRLGKNTYWEEWDGVRRVTNSEGVRHFKWEAE